MSCPHDEISVVHHETRWGHATMPGEGFAKLIYPVMLEHIGTCALSRSLVRAEGDVERGEYVVDDGEALLHYNWRTDTGRECETHSEGCICECCDPVDRNCIGGDDL
ncbi:hypothetical protein SEA_OBLADI_162 [Gordonia phage ObLaDi]|uniref:Uncharacterized protein n=2 Tax=Cafassovirus TaxID=3425056 RepID=A0A9E7QCE7_9CAUD|nr:hypothetical protein SEA_ALEEMILY_160 [Gordonia phage Aleemily]UXE03885.1 hypothetical protein SEA_OBLADI_162 [Gordonia phage ObLaDi]